jgi:hypothetical protein
MMVMNRIDDGVGVLVLAKVMVVVVVNRMDDGVVAARVISESIKWTGMQSNDARWCRLEENIDRSIEEIVV